jgi:hypothetical protein
MTEDDARWFQENPDRAYRLRIATEHEIAEFTRDDDTGDMIRAVSFYRIIRSDGRGGTFGHSAFNEFFQLQRSDKAIAQYLSAHPLTLE